MLTILTIPCLNDNYSYLIHDKNTNKVGVIDPSEFFSVNNAIQKKFKKLDYILNTHHHSDHVGGNEELKEEYNAKIICSETDRDRIPGSDATLNSEDNFYFGETLFRIIFVPGHTKGHIAFYSEKDEVIFTGDALFSLGCGRIFEGSYKQMFNSLNLIKKLPSQTKIYCGHEYTKNNLKFCQKYNKSNKNLKKKSEWINDRLSKNLATIPISLKDELDTNIFLRCDESALKKDLGMDGTPDELIFEKLRNLKDNF